MTMVSVRLSEELVGSLDELIDQGRFRTRTAAVHAALTALVREERRHRVDAAIVDGYQRVPPPQVDDDVAALAARSIDAEPW